MFRDMQETEKVSLFIKLLIRLKPSPESILQVIRVLNCHLLWQSAPPENQKKIITIDESNADITVDNNIWS